MSSKNKVAEVRINENSLQYKVFDLAVKIYSRFTGRSREGYKKFPNNCTYSRVILGAFIVMLLNMALYTSPIWIVLLISSWYPTTGIIGGGILIFSIILCFAVFIGAIFSWAYFHERYQEYKAEKLVRKGIAEEAIEKNPEISNSHTSWELFVQWVQDKHDYVCRPIVFVSSEESKWIFDQSIL